MLKKKSKRPQRKSGFDSTPNGQIPKIVLLLLLVIFLPLHTRPTAIVCQQSLAPTEELSSQQFAAAAPTTTSPGERVEEELVMIWGIPFPLVTSAFPKGSILCMDITLLPCSNSSVFFEYVYNYEPNDYWIPRPEDFTLAPGESLGAANYTLVLGPVERHGIIGYEAYVLTEGANATVRWWYEVIKVGKIIPNIGFVFTLGALTVIILFGRVFAEKRRKKNNK